MAPRSRGGVLTRHRPSEWLLPCRLPWRRPGGRRRALVRSFVVAGGARYRCTGVAGPGTSGSGPRPECRVGRCRPDRGDARDAAHEYGGPGEAASSRMRSAVSAGCVPTFRQKLISCLPPAGCGTRRRISGRCVVSRPCWTGPSTSLARTPRPRTAARSRSIAVHWLGRLPAQLISGWYERAAIYALPARYEPFGLSVLEAASQGCALVLGDIASLRENWDDAAVFVPPDDGEDLGAGDPRADRRPVASAGARGESDEPSRGVHDRAHGSGLRRRLRLRTVAA